MVKGSLDRLLTSFDKQGAVEYCKGMVNDLLQNRVDLSLLIITKGLSKKIASFAENSDDNNEEEENKDNKKQKGKKQKAPPKANKANTYKNNANQAHVKLAEKMRKRDAGSAPSVGDRVSYVMIKGMKGQKAYELAEDPMYVLEHDIPIDFCHYIDN